MTFKSLVAEVSLVKLQVKEFKITYLKFHPNLPGANELTGEYMNQQASMS